MALAWNKKMALSMLLVLPLTAGAACSRTMIVPIFPLGKLMGVNDADGLASGIYPELLQKNAASIGCHFSFIAAPHARAELMLSTGAADILLGAIKDDNRDRWGRFIPMLDTEWMLITDRSGEPPRTVQALLERSDIRLNVVRGYKYGPAYQHMLTELEKLGRVEYVKDPVTVVRKMLAGRADYTFMATTTFAGALADLGLKQGYGPKVRYSHIRDLPATVNGVYLSKRLPASDQQQIVALLNQIRDHNELLLGLRKFFAPGDMQSLRPLSPQATPH
jgi:polar amino acid transport system substrate-binding protein